MRSNNVKKQFVVVIMASLFAFKANAQSPEHKKRSDRRPTFEQLIKDMDTNEDGKLSKKEVKGPLKEHFAKIDSNEDGFITEKEFENAPKPKRKDRKRDN